FAMFVNNTTKVIIVTYSTLKGKIPIVIIPIAVKIFARRYHFFTVNVVSISGAQRNFKILGSNPIDTTGATRTKGMPALVRRYPNVTVTYPDKTPNGK
ncbi:MAG: hypothetical protein WCE54_21055, partial [Ignavibacteriaceae bacterium]